MDKSYYIEFDTKDVPGGIVAIRVRIDTQTFGPTKAKAKEFPINLCEHPLYPKLVKYVQNNPARVAKDRSS